MNFQIYWSLAISIVGLVFYFAATNPKLMEVGRIAYFAGLLAFCLLLGRQALHAGTP